MNCLDVVVWMQVTISKLPSVACHSVGKMEPWHGSASHNEPLIQSNEFFWYCI